MTISYARDAIDFDSEFNKVNEHEALLRRLFKDWQKISVLESSLTRNTWRFFQNSKMFPSWNEDSGITGIMESINDILKFHMDKWNKSAMILMNADAIRLHTILNVHKKPVYFGRDIINENLEGYMYFGSFPTKVIWNSKYNFETGIVNGGKLFQVIYFY